MEIEDGVAHDNIEAHILARTTAEQERKTRWVRCALALLVGVSFPNSAWYVYALQVVGLGTQGWCLSVWVYFEDNDATHDDEYDVQNVHNQTINFATQSAGRYKQICGFESHHPANRPGCSQMVKATDLRSVKIHFSPLAWRISFS